MKISPAPYVECGAFLLLFYVSRAVQDTGFKVRAFGDAQRQREAVPAADEFLCQPDLRSDLLRRNGIRAVAAVVFTALAEF